MRIKPFKLERYFAKWEFKAPYLLCCSDCQSFTQKELLAMAGAKDRQMYQNLYLGYTESLGHPILRQEIGKLYGQKTAERIITFAGAEEGIFALMNVLLNKGDQIIVTFPAYQSLYEVAQSIGCSVTKWQLEERNNWELDLDFLQSSITKKTKMIVVNFPHNPTGYLPSKEKFKQIAEIARQHNIYLFSDEVYRGLEYNSQDQLPAAADIYQMGISLGVMSKTFGLAGLRIGWLVINEPKLFKQVAGFKDYITICSSAPSEILSIIALKNRHRIVKRNLDIIKQNLYLLDDFFARHSQILSWRRPKAGCIAFPKLLAKTSSDQFCRRVLEKVGVLLLPSSKYDFGQKHFRIGYGKANFKEGLLKLERFLQIYASS